jgi:hypothetical protein
LGLLVGETGPRGRVWVGRKGMKRGWWKGFPCDMVGSRVLGGHWGFWKGKASEKKGLSKGLLVMSLATLR